MRNDTDYDEKKFDRDEYGNLTPREDDSEPVKETNNENLQSNSQRNS